ncbi:Salicylate hydroxylase [Mycena venus]|uniref:Salicylate hydroxylase n=1 Tax=Mycena venus TaxID=2733690 RepID=A0A8H6X6C6_9AGAR|nr:Salicylate hydroxylase [Mycena venus]
MSSNASKSFTVAVVGGGIAGLTLAIALEQRGIPVQVYERTPHFREIGAGISFSPNAVRAMEVCALSVRAAFDAVATLNGWESKRKVWFDYYDGMAPEACDILFTISSSTGQNGLHRAHFLDELVKQFPAEKAHFGKMLEDIEECDSGKLVMRFADGTTAEADAVVGCDGIHSRVRKLIIGEDHPAARPTYTHKYAYRGLVPMQKAIEAIGEEKARNSCMFLGERGHVLTFPMERGEILNMVAFHEDKSDWADDQHMTRPSTREAALEDFKDFGHDVTKVLELTPAENSIWAIFDLCHPLPTYTKGRLLVTGDAAHATSPHHGSGAGFAIEDSAFLAELLADERVKSTRDLEAVFATFDEARRERGNWLVKSSRFVGEADEAMAPGIGPVARDWKKIQDEVEDRYYNTIISYDTQKEADKAKELLHNKLA